MNLQNLAYLLAVANLGEVEVVDLKDGFVRVKTAKYSVEVPKGWEIGEETSFGQREIVSDKGELGLMTGGKTRSSWEQLYQTSLYFIRRSSPGTPTPFRLGKNKRGYETMSFEMIDAEKRPLSKYVIFKNKESEILALSVKIPSQKSVKDMDRAFERLLNSAEMK